VPTLDTLRDAAHSLGLPTEDERGALAVFLSGRLHLCISERKGQAITAVRYGPLPEGVFTFLTAVVLCTSAYAVLSLPRFGLWSWVAVGMALLSVASSTRDYRTTRRWRDKVFQRAYEMGRQDGSASQG